MADIREDVMVDEEIALTDIDSGMIISYDELGSKPSINGVEVEGAKTSADYGLAAAGASYTKAEEDTLLSAKADKADTYTKAETDAKLSIKADSGDSYTKAEEDALLGKKADAASVYTKSQTDSAISAAKPDLSGYYTKAQTDSAISATQPDLTPYAKTADVDTKLGTKADTSALGEYQEKLTAGDNITIANNVISADVPAEATETTAGLMSTDDKQKVGEIGPIPTDDLTAILA